MTDPTNNQNVNRHLLQRAEAKARNDAVPTTLPLSPDEATVARDPDSTVGAAWRKWESKIT